MGLRVKEHRKEGAMAPSFGAHQPYPMPSSASLTGRCLGPWVPIACCLAPAARCTHSYCAPVSGGPLPPSLPPGAAPQLPAPPAACSGLQGQLHLTPAHRGPAVAETPSLGSWK